ncbi:MAG: ABC transporter permease subunit [Planctomycetota bacterium]|jgi:NitT/TauT family transport system permease protein|nr:ABC transporter permease subunit [Planctomycetota bacterium]
MKKAIPALVVFAVFLLFWQYAADAGWVSPILLPSPLAVCRYLFDAGRDGILFSALGVTLGRLLVGYILGALGGLLLGFILYASPLARNTLGLAALGLQTLPSVCWAPMAILWFGQTEGAMYFVVVMGSLWSIAISVETAIRAVPDIYLRAARVMGSSGQHVWRTVVFPAALPQILGGAKQGWAFAWRSLMAAEIYVAIIRRFGIGQLLHFGRELNAMDQVVGVMVVIVIVGLLVDRAIFLPVDKYLRRTRGK